MSEYLFEDYNSGITQERWLDLLQNESIFNYECMCIMRRFFETGETSCKELAKKYSGNHDSYSGRISSLCRDIYEKVGCPLPDDTNTKSSSWAVLFSWRKIGKDEDLEGSFSFKLRPELLAALTKLNEEGRLDKYKLIESPYDWVPFYEELANKILIYRDNQPELISKLRNINSDDINLFIQNDEEISPFGIFESFNRNGLRNNPSQRREILSALKDTFEIQSEIPSSLPDNVRGQNSDYFTVLQKRKGLIETTWNLLQAMCLKNEEEVIKYYDEFLTYDDAGYISLTIAMFWILPSQYLPCVVEIRNKFDRDFGIQIPVSNLHGQEYLRLLKTEGLNNIPEFVKAAVKEYNSKDFPDMKRINEIRIKLLQELDRAKYTTPKRMYKNSTYAWIGTTDGIIGNDTCHYEFYFEDNKLYIDAHFEDKFYSKFSNVGKSQGIKHVEWDYDAVRINPEGIDINDENIVQKGLAYLDEIETKIGKELRSILMSIKNNKTSEIVDLLRTKKNIILQGAPGTGKTYTTAEVALSLLGKDISAYPDHDALMKDYEDLSIKIDEDSGEITSGQIGFVTFHQSMDYEDFVEGLKPETIDGNVSYYIEDGIFKAIANKAKYKKSSNFDDAYSKFISDIGEYNEENPFKLTTRTKSEFAVTVNSHNNLSLYTGSSLRQNGVLTKTNILKQIHGEEKYKGWEGYFYGVIDYLSSKYGYKEQQESPKDYVLIIDEINRGNVSKIFGELITLLEADKRTGEKHPLSITLPYSKERFAVPSNLYIIGTMNTTDRSVGNIDYAVRRRFSFVTLESNRSVVVSHNNNDESSTAVLLFDAVMKFLKANRTDMDIDDLMVGHSYFLAKDEDELQTKWKYDILPLLREYYKDGITKKDVKKDCTIQDFIDSQNE